MTLRTAHGTGAAALIRVETSPVDELPAGVQAPAVVEAGGERRPDGTFAEGSRTAQQAGGRARREQTKLASRVGFIPPSAEWAPYRKMAAAFRREHCRHLARTVGGGVCSSGPSSIVASAALMLAGSRFLFDSANGDGTKLATAARLADQSRTALLTAHELCAREAAARPAKEKLPWDR
jgi:hypothetical protein